MPWTYYITRRMFPGEAGRNIALADWISVVDSDPSMSIVASAFDRPVAERMSAAVWHNHSGLTPVVLEWLSGTIVVERPDAQTLTKLHDLAARLEAHVEDEEGGWYDNRGQFLGHLAAG